MLNKLSLHSFQAHEDTVLEFSPGVNVITGTSNSGKTSIVRALNWLVNNRPLGDGFIKDDKEETFVDLRFDRRDSCCSVRRSRDRKSGNFYQTGPIQRSFTAFGNAVPEEISELLNLSDINLQQQLSPYFLVLDSPGQVALYIRKVAKLDEIDQVVSVLSSELRECTKEKSSLDTELQKIREEIEELSVIDLDRLEKCIEKIKSLSQRKEEASDRREEISTFVELIKQLDQAMVCLPDDVEEKIGDVESKLSDYEDLLDNFGELGDLVVSLKEVEGKEINLPKGIKDKISFTENLIAKYNNNEQKLVYLLEILENIEDNEIQSDDIGEKHVQVESERKDLLGRLKNCPYCEQKLSGEAQQILIGE